MGFFVHFTPLARFCCVSLSLTAPRSLTAPPDEHIPLSWSLRRLHSSASASLKNITMAFLPQANMDNQFFHWEMDEIRIYYNFIQHVRPTGPDMAIERFRVLMDLRTALLAKEYHQRYIENLLDINRFEGERALALIDEHYARDYAVEARQHLYTIREAGRDQEEIENAERTLAEAEAAAYEAAMIVDQMNNHRL